MEGRLDRAGSALPSVSLIRVRNDDFFCKKPLTESYGIFSYTSPAREKLILCPSVKATCCPAYEQFKLFNHFHKVVKPYFKVFEQVISASLGLMKGRIIKFFELNLPEKISKLKSNSKKLLMGDKYNKLNRQEQILEVLTKMEERLPTTLEYMDHLKSLFFCTVCGYGNQQFIDIPTKSISFSSDSCDSLVRNTFQFAYLMNNLLLPFIMDVSEFIVKAMKDKKHKMLKLKPLGLINKAVDDCAKDYRDNDEGLNNCLAYCSFFKLNRNTPEIEGYPELFFNFLVQVDVFIATGGTIKEKAPPATKKEEPPAKKDEKKDDKKKDDKAAGAKLRLLEELLGGEEFMKIKYRILEEQAKAEQAKPEAKKPGQDFVDPFDPVNMMKRLQSGDILSHEGVDSNYDDGHIAEAMAIEEELSMNRVGGVDVIIRRHYADSYEPEIDDIDSEDIFSRPVKEKVHLDKFTSKFGFTGIDFTILMQKVDWNMNMRTLVSSLQGKKDTGPTNDHLDLKVMELANSVNNKFVIEFHRDNYLDFEGTHLHQPNNVIKELSNFMNDKVNQEYVKTTQRVSNLLENVAGKDAVDMFKTSLKSSEDKFAFKVAMAMSRVNKRFESADLVQLKEIEDKIGGASIEQLVELQSDLIKMSEKCAGEKKSTAVCKEAYNRLADIFDLDPLDAELPNYAQELLTLNMKYKTKDRKESIEELKKDKEALAKLEGECKAKIDTPECQEKLFELAVVYETEPSPTFFETINKLIDELLVKAEKKAKSNDNGGGEGAEGAEGADAGKQDNGDGTKPAEVNTGSGDGASQSAT